MDTDKIICILRNHVTGISVDVEIPTDITASELIIGLNEGFKLGMKTADVSRCSLKTENPIALLRGNKLVREYGLHNGTIIHFT